MLIYYWPHLLAVPFGLVAMWQGVRVLRRWRFRGVDAGEPMCRKCHYQLTKCESPTCPECGVELTGRNRLTARPINRHALAQLLVMLGVLAALIGLTQIEAVRYGKVSRWLELDSLWLADKVHAWRGGFLPQRPHFAHCVLLLEQRSASTGEVIRVLHVERQTRWRLPRTGVMFINTSWSNDGRTLWVTCNQPNRVAVAHRRWHTGQRDELRIFDTTTGQLIERRMISLTASYYQDLVLDDAGTLYEWVYYERWPNVLRPQGNKPFKQIVDTTIARFTFTGESHNVRRHQLTSGAELFRIYKMKGTDGWHEYRAAVSSDARIVWLLVKDPNANPHGFAKPHLLVKDIVTDQYIARYDAPNDWHHCLRVSPDGQRALLMQESGEHLRVYDLKHATSP